MSKAKRNETRNCEVSFLRLVGPLKPPETFIWESLLPYDELSLPVAAASNSSRQWHDTLCSYVIWNTWSKENRGEIGQDRTLKRGYPEEAHRVGFVGKLWAFPAIALGHRFPGFQIPDEDCFLCSSASRCEVIYRNSTVDICVKRSGGLISCCLFIRCQSCFCLWNIKLKLHGCRLPSTFRDLIS